MPLENAQFITELNPAWPLGTDGVNTSDDHHRNTKTALQQSFPAIAGPVLADQDDLNLLAGAATLGSGLNPTGTIIMFYGPAAPDGYLAADGAAIDLQYADLIALVGANTPTLQGAFIRGASDDAAVDPDGPRAAGSTQGELVGPHTHPIQGHKGGASDSNRIVASSGSETTVPNTLNNAGAETRPKNIALLYCIRW